MAHDIKPNSQYSIVTVKLATTSVNPDELADGLNDFFRPEVGEGWVADYALLGTDQPFLVESSASPEENELFERVKDYVVCIQDSDYNEDWVKFSSELELEGLTDEELRKVLSGKIVIGDDDRVFLGCLNTMGKVTLQD